MKAGPDPCVPSHLLVASTQPRHAAARVPWTEVTSLRIASTQSGWESIAQ